MLDEIEKEIEDMDWEWKENSQWIKELLSEDRVTFYDALSKLKNSLLHQGTIYPDTVRGVPILWKIIDHHLEKGNMDYIYSILDFCKDIVMSDDYDFEPFGYDAIGADPSNLSDKYQIIQVGLPVLLKLLKVENARVKNQAVNILRYLETDAKQILEQFRKVIFSFTHPIALSNLLMAMAILDVRIGNKSDVPLIKGFIQEGYPDILRFHALFSLLIVSEGEVPDELVQVIESVSIFEGCNQFSLMDISLSKNLSKGEDQTFPPDHIRKIQSFSKNENDNIDLTFLSPFNDYWRYLFFIRPGANELLTPMLLKLFSDGPILRVGFYNVMDTLISILFPNGFDKWLSSNTKLNKLQYKFMRILMTKIPRLQANYYDKTIKTLLREKGFEDNLEGLSEQLLNSKCKVQFNEYDAFKEFMSLKGLKHEENKLGQIVEIKIDDKEAVEIPETIGKLSSLRKLELRCPKVKRLPESFGNLNALEHFFMRMKGLEKLPDSFSNLESLKILNIGAMLSASPKMNSLPEDFGNLHSLEELEIYNSNLSEFPESIGKLSNLRKLKLFCPKVKRLPESFGNLDNLEYFFWKGIKIGQLPECIGRLSSLDFLNLWGKGLTALPKNIGNLKNVTTLRVLDSSLSILPDSIGELVSLKKMNIEDSKIKVLPESIAALISLEELNLDSNELKGLPENLKGLKNLKNLSLNNNNFKEIPEQIKELKNLKRLNMRGNSIKKFPTFISERPNLMIDLGSNPIQENCLKDEECLKNIVETYNEQLKLQYDLDPDSLGKINIFFLYAENNTKLIQLGVHCEFTILKAYDLGKKKALIRGMHRLADFLKKNDDLREMFRARKFLKNLHEFFKDPSNLPSPASIKQHVLRYLSEVSEGVIHSPLVSFVKRVKIYLEDDFNLNYCLGVAQAVIEKSESDREKDILYQAKCCLAHAHLKMGREQDLKNAKRILEDIKQKMEELFDDELYQQVREKLEKNQNSS